MVRAVGFNTNIQHNKTFYSTHTQKQRRTTFTLLNTNAHMCIVRHCTYFTTYDITFRINLLTEILLNLVKA
jgi:hypothetical protein